MAFSLLLCGTICLSTLELGPELGHRVCWVLSDSTLSNLNMVAKLAQFFILLDSQHDMSRLYLLLPSISTGFSSLVKELLNKVLKSTSHEHTRQLTASIGNTLASQKTSHSCRSKDDASPFLPSGVLLSCFFALLRGLFTCHCYFLVMSRFWSLFSCLRLQVWILKSKSILDLAFSFKFNFI